MRVLAWTTAAIIVALNLRLAGSAIADWLEAAGRWRHCIWVAVVPGCRWPACCLLGWVRFGAVDAAAGSQSAARRLPSRNRRARTSTAPVYKRILVPLDHTALDRLAVSHAAAMAKLYGARIYLLHVEEGVTSQVYGPEASTAEVEVGDRIPRPNRANPS